MDARRRGLATGRQRHRDDQAGGLGRARRAGALDVGALLRPGPNTIEVEVATSLINRLRTVTPAIYGVTKRQDYGLLGPVQLLPYVGANAH